MNIIAWDKSTDKAVTPERMPINGEWCCYIDGKRTTKRQYNDFPNGLRPEDS